MSSRTKKSSTQGDGTKDVLFGQGFSMYFVGARTGNIFKIPEEIARPFYERNFLGNDFYQGRFLPSIKKIKNPVLFINVKNFINVTMPVIDHEDRSRESLREFNLSSLECVVMAKDD